MPEVEAGQRHRALIHTSGDKQAADIGGRTPPISEGELLAVGMMLQVGCVTHDR
jgi:hypothetical protein